MRIDMNRMAAAAIDAALGEDERPRHSRFTGWRAMAAGAALALVGREAVKRAPRLPRVTDMTRIPDLVRDRLAERGWMGEEPDVDDEPEDEFDDDEFDEEEDGDREPEAEVDEEDEEEDEVDEEEDEVDEEEDFDDEPEAELDEDEEPETEADEGDEGDDDTRNGAAAPGIDVGSDGGNAGAGSSGVMQLLNRRRTPPVMSRSRDRAEERVDPVDRPPEPPDHEREDPNG